MMGVGLLKPMLRVNRILNHPVYQEYMQRMTAAERERRYCRHGYDHGLAVARIAYAYLLEQGTLEINKEVIYAAALLHDIGRWVEYAEGQDHAEAGAGLADPILDQCGFGPDETGSIVQSIREHRRDPGDHVLSQLGRALALADDWARDCRHCPSQAGCYKFSADSVNLVY